ncbi:L-type lectin-domain containing receptor kinase IX.1-like protein [Tanacetum coccineum]
MFVIGSFFTFICLRKKTGANDQTIDQNPDGGPVAATVNSWEPRRFTFEEQSLSTDNFNSDQKLGEGAFGVVYKATLTTGEQFAVKKIKGTSRYETELLVVYELMENLSLDVHLFDSSRESLPWDMRYNIAQGLAKAMRYLHNECGKCCILHRDIKAGNVLLDFNFEAQLSDFGLAKLLDPDTSMSCPVGTPGYIDPEYVQNGWASQLSNVNRYGMVVLEMVTGRRCIGYINADQEGHLIGLAEWLKGIAALGLWCVSLDYLQRRPNITYLTNILDRSDQDAFSFVPNFEDTELEALIHVKIVRVICEEFVDLKLAIRQDLGFIPSGNVVLSSTYVGKILGADQLLVILCYRYQESGIWVLNPFHDY